MRHTFYFLRFDEKFDSVIFTVLLRKDLMHNLISVLTVALTLCIGTQLLCMTHLLFTFYLSVKFH